MAAPVLHATMSLHQPGSIESLPTRAGSQPSYGIFTRKTFMISWPVRYPVGVFKRGRPKPDTQDSLTAPLRRKSPSQSSGSRSGKQGFFSESLLYPVKNPVFCSIESVSALLASGVIFQNWVRKGRIKNEFTSNFREFRTSAGSRNRVRQGNSPV